MGNGNRNYKCRSLSLGAFRGNTPTVALGDLPADRQANTVSVILTATMQSLEDDEEAVDILFIKTDAIVLHGDLAAPLGRRASLWVLGQPQAAFIALNQGSLPSGKLRWSARPQFVAVGIQPAP